MGAITTALAKLVPALFTPRVSVSLLILPVCGGSLLVAESLVNSLYGAVTIFIVYVGITEFCYTVASAQLASATKSAHYGQIFCLLTFVSAILQTIVQIGIEAADLSASSMFLIFGVSMIAWQICSGWALPFVWRYVRREQKNTGSGKLGNTSKQLNEPLLRE
jgi:hypothetical protein